MLVRREVVVQRVYVLAEVELFCVFVFEELELVVEVGERAQMGENLEVALAYVHAFHGVDLEQSVEQMFDAGRQTSDCGFVVGAAFVTSNQFGFVFALPGVAAGGQVVDEHSECEGVTFARVNVVNQCLNRHIEGTADEIVLFESILGLKAGGEAEVAEFEGVIFDEDVGWFDVSVYNLSLCEVLTGQSYLVGGLFPVELCSGVDGGLQRSSFTVLGDDVIVILGVVDIDEFQDVGVVHFFQGFNFVLQKMAQMGLHVVEADYLHGDYVGLVVVFEAAVDCAAEAGADLVF